METQHNGNFPRTTFECRRQLKGLSIISVGPCSSLGVDASFLLRLLAPEYALREQIVTASDMYSLGCVIYAVHAKARLTSTKTVHQEIIRSYRDRLPSRITIVSLP
jgi:hypothetical protein